MATTAIRSRSAARTRGPLAHLGSARFLLTHWRLLWRLTRNEISARFAGSLLGGFWIFVAPLLILVVYSVVYVGIYGFRAGELSSTQYVIFLFAGLVPFLAGAEALAVGVGSVLANKSVLSNTVFPIDLAPVKVVLTSQAQMVLGMSLVIAGGLLVHTAHWTVVLFPIVWALQIMGLIGLTWVISLLNVIFRDLQNMLGAILMMVFIISPIAYIPEQVPSQLKFMLLFNPFAYYVTAYQKLLVFGTVPSARHWLALALLSLVPFVVGSWFFSSAKRVIIDYV